MNKKEVEELIEKCAKHAWERHSAEGNVKRNMYEGSGIDSQQALYHKIYDVVFDERTECFLATNNRDVFYSREDNFRVILDKDGYGTCIVGRPRQFDSQYNDEMERVIISGGKWNDMSPILTGGVLAIYPELFPAESHKVQTQVLSEKPSFQPNDPLGPPTSAQERHQWATEGLSRNDPQAQREALIVEEKQFTTEQASLREAAEKSKDEAEKKRLELRAEIEKADHDAVTKKVEAKLNGQENGFDSKESLRASREAKAADKTYEAGKQEWHKRSVRDDSYQPFDAALSQKAEAAREREAASRAKLQARSKAEGWDHQREQAQREALQRKQDAALDQSFSMQSSYGHDR